MDFLVVSISHFFKNQFKCASFIITLTIFLLTLIFLELEKKLKKERLEGIPVQKNLPLFTAALVSRILTQGKS